jgi:hypothetical protein
VLIVICQELLRLLDLIIDRMCKVLTMSKDDVFYGYIAKNTEAAYTITCNPKQHIDIIYTSPA